MKDLRLVLCPIENLSQYKHFYSPSGSKKKAPRSLDARVNRFVLFQMEELPPGVLYISAAPPTLSLKAKKRAAPSRSTKRPKPKKN